MEPRPHANEAESPQSAPDRARGVAPQAPSVAKAAQAAQERDFQMRIDRDGTWYYQGSPINRLALVKLFSTVLHRKDDGSFWLTTPIENGRIAVEDAPFIAVAVQQEGEGRAQVLRFRTNIDDIVPLDDAHPLRIEEQRGGEPRPYIFVRRGLEARLARSVFYELVEMAEPDPVDAAALGVWSAGRFFPLGRIS